MALQFVAPELRVNRSIILAACARFGRAFEFLEAPLKNDRTIALVAVSNDGIFREELDMSPPHRFKRKIHNEFMLSA